MPKVKETPILDLPNFEDVVKHIDEIEKISEIPRLMRAWGSIKKEALRRKKLFDEMETIRKRIEKQIKYSMTIPHNALESEKIELTGIGTVQKMMKPALKVHDWTALFEWVTEKGWTEIIQKRLGQTALVELEQQLIDDADLHLPEDIAEFKSFPQLAINKSTKLQ